MVTSNRTCGKAFKRFPKDNPVPTGKTTAGYSPAAVERRSLIRDLKFDGLTKPQKKKLSRKS